jgi:chemotaxis methyl-accepting protein methylase
VKDADCTAFLQWALPRLGMRWAGFRRVRGQVCKRLGRRKAELGLRDLADYRALLETSLRDLPESWRAAFEQSGGEYCLRADYRRHVRFLLQDIRHALPEGRFDLILCRNLVFTYFETPVQAAIAGRLVERLETGGMLLLGIHESLTESIPTLVHERTWLCRRR